MDLRLVPGVLQSDEFAFIGGGIPDLRKRLRQPQ
jgi:hypothetical protein